MCGGRTVLFAAIAAIAVPAGTRAQQVDWKAVEEVMGRAGSLQTDGVYRFSMPRSDLRVTIDGLVVSPALALGSWMAMKPRADGGVMAMGDLVLVQDEIEPVLLELQNGGVMQTAVHNHLLFETPRVMYVHIHAEGDAAKIARAVHGALALTATPGAAAAGAGRPALPLDTAAIATTLDRAGSTSGGVYKVSVPRPEKITVNGEAIPASMGVATAIGFQPTGKGAAAVTGDFVLTASEVNPVIRALREHGILVTALHNHLLFDEPHLFFMHFWATGDAVETARGLRAALDHIDTRAAR